MGIFATPQTDQFRDLSNDPSVILTASEHTIQINNILVSNISNGNIQFNLGRRIAPLTGDPISTQIITNRLIPSPTTRNSARDQSEISLGDYFPYFLGNNPEGSTDTLSCWSNGKGQKFDLQISYTILNETPFNGSC